MPERMTKDRRDSVERALANHQVHYSPPGGSAGPKWRIFISEVESHDMTSQQAWAFALGLAFKDRADKAAGRKPTRVEGKEFTPFPRGEMPQGVQRFEDGPPFGRLLLTLAHFPDESGEVVRDLTTGESFRITLGMACGLGCRCAAEAEWVQ